MPTYEYRCPAGHDFEHFVLRISEAVSVLPCPTCGAEAQRRISAGGGLVFKGSGFYITDYGKDGKKDQRARPSKTASATGDSAAVATGGASESAGTTKAGSESAGAAPASTEKTGGKSSGDSKASAPATGPGSSSDK